MDRIRKIEEILDELGGLSPAGYAVALHVNFTTPRFLFQTYPKDWMEEYSRRGFVLRDPTVRWGLEHDGVRRWSELTSLDDDGVLGAAREYGLAFGVTIAKSSKDSKSVSSFAAEDREFSDEEIARFAGLIAELHELTADIDASTPKLEAELKRLSIDATHS